MTVLFCSCDSRREESPVIPPVNYPLSRLSVGYGVVTASYIHVLAEPKSDAASMGYVRRGSIVEIMERRQVHRNGDSEPWVLIEGSYNGWLQEANIQIYDNESQAKTAAENLR
ncbi:hypothetical protein JFL75_14090 [Breznakiella homolactica]|uniref:SH3 domain-containing protein n=2 Tax=Breznakiella homolactica TaxID=2798577 RepID=A0A7T7XRZ6_9SPIR|nr:hypothetical protein JFL75_14090 [Breznakiella homolactica]